MTVLVIAPHPDDETIGCGGTLTALSDGGQRVVAVFLTSGELGLPSKPVAEARAIREEEAEKAAAVLGLARTVFFRGPDWALADQVAPLSRSVRELVEQEAVTTVYVPHALDDHPDHSAAFRVMSEAGRSLGSDRPAVHTYEIWTPMSRWVRAEDITAVMPRKLEALRAHASQLGYYDYERAVEGLARYRGALTTRTAYAEAFGDAGGD